MTYRRVRVLLDRLPPESATKTAMRNEMSNEELAAYAKEHKTEQHGPWSNTEMLLAQIIDHLALNEYAVYRAQGGKPKKPEPYPRPGVVRKNSSAKPAGGKPARVDVTELEKLRHRPRE